MRYEWKKLFVSPYVCLFLLAVLVVNGTLFYQRCTNTAQGFSQVQVREKFDQQIDLQAEIEMLEQRTLDADSYEDASLVTGDLLLEQMLDREVLTQQKAVSDYPLYLQQRQDEIHARLSAGLTGAEGSYTYRGQQAVADAYHQLEGLPVQVSFSGGVQMLSGWYLTDLLLLFYAAISALTLLTQERTDGMLLILCTTRCGRSRLFLRKFAALLLFVTAGFLLLYGTNLVISSTVLGLGDLTRPIQSVPDFISCPVPLTVMGYLLAFFLQKLLWLWTACAMAAIWAVMARNASIAIVGWSVLAGIGLLLQQSHREWLESCSLVSQCMVEVRYQDCLMMNLFGTPVPRRIIFIAACILLFFVGVGISALYCDRCSPVAGNTFKMPHWLRPGRHVSLARHEAYKLFITRGGALLLITFLLVQLGIYAQPHIRANPNYEPYLRYYSDILEGAPSKEKEDFLLAEETRFQEIQERIAEYEFYADDEGLAAILTTDLKQELMWQDAFEDAKAQYHLISPGEHYVHPSGYERLYGSDGRRDFLSSLSLCSVFLVVSLGGIFSAEQESGVSVLQATAGATRSVRRRKWWLAMTLTLLLALIAFLPEYVAIAHTFGLHQTMALASSLPVFRSAPAAMRIWQVLAISAGIRLVWSLAAMALVLILSQKTKNTIVSMILSLAILLLPPLVLLMI